MPHYTPEQMIEAIREAEGVVTAACRILECSRRTFYDYCAKHPELQTAYDEAKKKTDDAVQQELLGICFDRDHKDQLAALKYYTACKMGWRVGTDITSKGERVGEVRVTIVDTDDGDA